jgi:Holliday junction resolvase RusA-like endonuclease
MITFHVDGIPVQKNRPRFRRVGNFVQIYSDAKTVKWEDQVKTAAERAMGSQEVLETPVSVYLYFRLSIPKSTPKKRLDAFLEGLVAHTKKPDIDNLAKSVLDGMDGVVYKNDSQITTLHLKKVYAADPGVSILVKEELE